MVLSDDSERLAAKAQSITRPPNEEFLPLVGSPDEAVAYYQALVDAGLQYFLANTRAADEETLDLLAERVIPRVGLN